MSQLATRSSFREILSDLKKKKFQGNSQRCHEEELIANKSRVGEQSQDVGREKENTMEDRLSAKDNIFRLS